MPDDSLIEFGGKSWCRFHLPLEAEKAQSEKARWTPTDAFEKKILSYVYQAKETDRVADLSGVVFPPWPISFGYHCIDSSWPSILFINAVFPHGAVFNTITFSGEARFYGATFGDTSEFNQVTFDRWATFKGASFFGRVEFNAAVFKDYTDFYAVTCGSEAQFRRAIFVGDAVFLGDPSREGLEGVPICLRDLWIRVGPSSNDVPSFRIDASSTVQILVMQPSASPLNSTMPYFTKTLTSPELGF